MRYSWGLLLTVILVISGFMMTSATQTERLLMVLVNGPDVGWSEQDVKQKTKEHNKTIMLVFVLISLIFIRSSLPMPFLLYLPNS